MDPYVVGAFGISDLFSEAYREFGRSLRESREARQEASLVTRFNELVGLIEKERAAYRALMEERNTLVECINAERRTLETIDKDRMMLAEMINGERIESAKCREELTSSLHQFDIAARQVIDGLKSKLQQTECSVSELKNKLYNNISLATGQRKLLVSLAMEACLSPTARRGLASQEVPSKGPTRTHSQAAWMEKVRVEAIVRALGLVPAGA